MIGFEPRLERCWNAETKKGFQFFWKPLKAFWLRGGDLNPRPLGYEPNELPDCSTPRQCEEQEFYLTMAPGDNACTGPPSRCVLDS